MNYPFFYKKFYFLQISILALFVVSCNSKKETIKPVLSSISESVYASGIIKSENQYQAFAMATGTISTIYIREGDLVRKGSPLLTITNEIQKLTSQNASLAAQFSDIRANKSKLDEAIQLIELQKNKLYNDSLMLDRQQRLWGQGIGSKVELEQRELAYKNSKTSYFSARIRYQDLKRQLDLSSSQSKNSFEISKNQERDYTLKSDIEGMVYKLYKEKGESVNPQTPIALIGDAHRFVLEMQVDEADIFKVKKGMRVLITMDSYRGEFFEATVSFVSPMMNEKSKTFTVEAIFTKPPAQILPSISFEANIILQTKSNALLIPRSYLIADTKVLNNHGDTVLIKTGLKDYQMIEVLNGLTRESEIQKPK